jgi:hypothetical protein
MTDSPEATGGTTCHLQESRDAIGEAAQFLATTPLHERPKPLVPALKTKFGLSALGTCQAIRESRSIRARTA